MFTEEFDSALGASYRLEALLGSGASGEVWLGVDRRTDEPVAAKVLHREHLEDDDLVDRFLRERSILIKLRHENVVAVTDLVVEGDRLAIVMEYVDGGSLRDVLRVEGPLAPGLAVGVTAAVLEGVAAAHDRAVLHRDVKPDNVLLSKQWRELGPGGVKLSDFGISQILADLGSTTGGLVGTPEYMAPEQLVTGVGDLPADVYGAGILLYELLAGRTPFAGAGTGYAVAHRHVTSSPPHIPVPDSVWAEIEDMLAKNPTRRPTAREAAARLRNLRADVAHLPPLPAQDDPVKFASAGGSATEVRGLTPPPKSDADSVAAPSRTAAPAPLPDLGTPGPVTMLRPMPTLPVAPPVEATPAGETEADRPPLWRNPRAIALVVAGVLLVGGGVFWVLSRGSGQPVAAPPVTPSIKAQQQSEVRPTGLGINRVATWDPQARTTQLTITYSAQRSPLEGPYLEVLPAVGNAGPCPEVQWQAVLGRLNPASVTGMVVPCGWSVAAPRLSAQGNVTVTATMPMELPAAEPDVALQEWLESAAQATEAATTDAQVTSTAYPAQRLTEVQVVGPARTVSGKTLAVSLIPVWPSGADELNPLFQSPPSGDPASTLVSIAGGNSGVRFSDACSGALSVSSDRLVVTAVSVAERCQIGATVGNFTDLVSNEFAIATRGS